VTIKNPIST